MIKIIETKRKNGLLVGREVSRQRRWQLRNPEKFREIAKRYRNKHKKERAIYNREYYQKKCKV